MRWFSLLIPNLVMLVLAYLLAPVLPLFATKENHLPKWLAFFDTPDNPIDGDGGFKEQHAPFKGEQTGWRRYINRVRWLWRNPSYGFNWTVLAYHPKAGEVARVIYGTRKTIGGDLKLGGWYFARQGSAWQLFINHHWNETHCCKFNFGWKLWMEAPSYTCYCPPWGLWRKYG